MNRKQKTAIWIGTIAAVAMGVYPPWVQSWDPSFRSGGQHMRVGMGSERYSWIFDPPGTPEWVKETWGDLDDPLAKDRNENDTLQRMLLLLRNDGYWRARLDLPRLIIQWLMVGFVVVALVMTLGRRQGS